MSKDNIFFADPSIDHQSLAKAEKNEGFFEDNDLVKSLIQDLRSNQTAQAVAFDTDPNDLNKYSGMYIDKTNTPLLPDYLLKKVSVVDDLVAAIVRARSNHISSFGNPLQDRYSQGFRMDPIKGSGFPTLTQQKKAELLKKVAWISKMMESCGNQAGLDSKQKQSFSEFLYLSAANAVRFGRITTEVLRDSYNKFCGFRAVDPATIYFARPNVKGGDNLRRQAIKKLKEIADNGQDTSSLDFKKYEEGDYDFVQVINGVPQNVFTEDEMINTNFYPTTDYECNYYPITPIDTVINAIVTHINITTHNKLYFQNGRAAKGMIVINSDEVKDTTISVMRQQFNANINSVQNAWRVPVVKIGKEDQLAWTNIDAGGRDMEFQYLYDTNIRVILSAFQMSPEELPGWNHLSKGTNSQSLSEGDNEYKLEAARDVGIRPLLSSIQSFVNAKIIPLFDPEVAKYFSLRFYGLDAETPEREATRIEKEQQLWGSFNDTLRAVEKEEIPKHLGGEFPMALAYSQVLDKYVKVGVILEELFGIVGASKMPEYDYIRDQFYQQNKMVIKQQEMAEAQAQQQAAGGQDPNADPNAQQPGGAEQQQAQPSPEQAQSGNELSSNVDQAMQSMSKSETKKRKK